LILGVFPRAFARLASFSFRAGARPLNGVHADRTGRGGSAAKNGVVSLAELPTGSVATLAGSLLPEEDRRLLAAMGLSDHSPVRICRQGEPCIVEVRTTRVGIARSIAERLHAEPIRPN
jgi:Fe2+ transport system protein FeoA